MLGGNANAYNAGFKPLSFTTEKRSIDLALWYPTTAEEKNIHYRAWQGKAARAGKIANGSFPLLLFSHGMNGSPYNQHYLAEFMARHGYAVFDFFEKNLR